MQPVLCAAPRVGVRCAICDLYDLRSVQPVHVWCIDPCGCYVPCVGHPVIVPSGCCNPCCIGCVWALAVLGVCGHRIGCVYR